uniref:Solute carrier family 22 member 4 n=1 Tax=Paramormyrops kingsleyae TaxID=1676925 RepID=A0A3B3RKG7_9TELE
MHGKIRDYDEITSFIGTWGPFQCLILFSLVASILPNGFICMYIVFVGDSPHHECLIPETYNISEAWRRAIVPVVMQDGERRRSSCTIYSLAAVSNFSRLGYVPDVDVDVSEIEQESCRNGWKYSNETYQSTITAMIYFYIFSSSQSWQLFKRPLTTSIYFLGVMVGTFISGHLSDRYGRRPLLFAVMIMQMVTISIQIFSPSWEAFSAIFFFVGLGGFSNYLIAYVLGSEILSPQTRVVFCSLGVFLSSSLGYMAMPLAGYFIRSWRLLLVAMAASGILYIPLWWIVPESPRWLLSQGRVREAEAILRDAARRNGVMAPPVIFTQTELEYMVSVRNRRHSILDIAKSSHAVSITVLCSLLWTVIILGYQALVLNTSNLHGNPYLNCFLSGIVEVPANLVAMIMLKYYSRHFCQSSTLLLGGTIILLILMIFLEMLGKFCITAAVCVSYTFTAELLPTVLRNTVMGICSTSARVGSILSPFIIHLGNHYKPLPYILIGGVTLLAGLLCLLLPESFGKPLPETTEQMQGLRGLGKKKLQISVATEGRSLVLKEAKF